MASGIKVMGDYNTLQNDLARFNGQFEDLTSYEFGKLTNDIAKDWKNGYNNEMNKFAPSMAKARILKKTSGKVYTTMVSVPQKAINYDLGEPRILNLRGNTNVQEWVKRKWKWNKYTSWDATKKYSGLSHVYGGKNKPQGTIIALSRKDKGLGSIIERQNEKSKSYAKQEFQEKAPKIFSRVGKSLLRKRIYRIGIQLNIGGK